MVRRPQGPSRTMRPAPWPHLSRRGFAAPQDEGRGQTRKFSRRIRLPSASVADDGIRRPEQGMGVGEVGLSVTAERTGSVHQRHHRPEQSRRPWIGEPAFAELFAGAPAQERGAMCRATVERPLTEKLCKIWNYTRGWLAVRRNQSDRFPSRSRRTPSARSSTSPGKRRSASSSSASRRATVSSGASRPAS